jgi:hypothetical protein
MSNNQVKDVYTIVKNDERPSCKRSVAPYVNKDGSLNVLLNALPLKGELNIRDPRPRGEAEGN